MYSSGGSCSTNQRDDPPVLTLKPSTRGWSLARWTEVDDVLVAGPVAQLALMPGVRLNLEEPTRSVEVPSSCWTTRAYAELSSIAGKHWHDDCGKLWESKRALFSHQRTGAQFLAMHRGGLLADAMGLGKTTSAIVAAETMARDEKPGAARLIIGPSFTRDVWKRELLATGAIEDEKQFSAVSSRDLRDPSFRPLEAHWWFAHYDVAHAWASRFVTNGRGRPIVSIVDEAHWIKNPRSKRTQGATVAAGSAASRIVLTGTPIPNRLSELWALLTLAQGTASWGSHFQFRERYCGAYNDGYGLKDGLVPTNVDEFSERLASVYLRRDAATAGLDMPPLSRQIISCEMSDADRVLHAEVASSLGGIAGILRALDRGAYGEDVFKGLHELRRLTCEVKLRTTIEHVASLIDQHERVVIFVHERKTVEKLGRALKDLFEDTSFQGITGEMPQGQRDHAVAKFQAGEIDCLIATYGSLREGVTLHAARAVVLHDLDWTPSAVLQAEARIHRIGQPWPCVSYWCMVHDSFDTLLARHLEHKGATIAAALGDSTAARALQDAGISDFTGSSIEAEAERLLAAWEARPS